MLKAFNAGSNDYISKPFKKEQLIALVEKYTLRKEQ
jgi:DNA-binding response OmpR family regulator